MDAESIIAGMQHNLREIDAGIMQLRENQVLADAEIVAFEGASDELSVLLEEGR